MKSSKEKKKVEAELRERRGLRHQVRKTIFMLCIAVRLL